MNKMHSKHHPQNFKSIFEVLLMPELIQLRLRGFKIFDEYD